MQASLTDAHRFLAERRYQDAMRACERRLREQREDAEARELYELAEQASRSNSFSAEQLFRLGAALQRAGMYTEAAREYREVIARVPAAAEAHNNLGSALEAAGDSASAEASFSQALRLKPDYVRALNNLGGLRLRAGDPKAALSILQRAVELHPEHAEAWINLGAARRATGQLEAAAAAYRRAIEARPSLAAVHFNLANVLEDLGDHVGANTACAEASRLDPSAVGPPVLRAMRLLAEGDLPAAEAEFSQISKAAPAPPEVALGLCGRLEMLGRLQDAIQLATRALERAPTHAVLRLELARLCRSSRRFEEARAVLEPLLAKGGRADAWSSLGYSLLQDGAERRDSVRLQQAIVAFERALDLEPDRVPERLALAMTLTDGNRGDLALAHVEKVLSSNPPPALAAAAAATLLEIRGFCVEPSRYEALADSIRSAVQIGSGSVPPLHVVLRFDEPALIQAAARQYMASQGIPTAARRLGVRRASSRLRVGYISPDFHNHPVAHSIAPVVEHHDRSRIEPIGIAIHSSDGSACGHRARASFDLLVDGMTLDARALAKLISDLDLDILVDLGGLTANTRPRALALRPAPVLASYLGYPATTGAPWTDYLIADRFVVPPDARAFYDEQVVWLPDTFLPGEKVISAGSEQPSRTAEGLPHDTVVFCNFNLPQRLNPPALEGFFRVLTAANDSVLWLRDPGPERARVLRERAEARGVSGGRIVFAEFKSTREAHLARLGLADLFLDTLPYNAHTTAREALAAGVPVLTCAGASFAGRVAGSVLTSLSLDELITSDVQAFERKAVDLASDAAARASLRARIAPAIARSTAFNPSLQARQLEAAYFAMHERSCSGEPPGPIDVTLDR